jgi:hypothetical protein
MSIKSISEAYLAMLAEATKVEVEDEKETDVDPKKKASDDNKKKKDPAADKGDEEMDVKEAVCEECGCDPCECVEEACSSKKKMKEASGDKEAYQKFFQSALKKFGVKSPAELDGDKEKEFYDYIDKNWESDDETNESISEARADYKYKRTGQYNTKVTVCYISPTTRMRACDDLWFKSKMDALGFKDNVKGFPKGAEVEAIKVMKESVELDEAKKEVSPKDIEDYLVKTGVNPKDAKDAVKKGFGYANKKYGGPTHKAAVKKIADVVWSLHEEMDEPASPDEKGMAMDQAKFIKYVGDEIMEYLNKNKEFPEWMQNKLSALHEKAKGLHATMAGKYNESVEIEEGKGSKASAELRAYAKKSGGIDAREFQVLAGKLDNFAATGNPGAVADAAKMLKYMDTDPRDKAIEIMMKNDPAMAKSVMRKAGYKLREEVELEEGRKLRNVLSDNELKKSMQKALADKGNYKGGKVNWNFIDADVYMDLSSKGYDLRHPNMKYMDRFDAMADKLDPDMKEAVDLEEAAKIDQLSRVGWMDGNVLNVEDDDISTFQRDLKKQGYAKSSSTKKGLETHMVFKAKGKQDIFLSYDGQNDTAYVSYNKNSVFESVEQIDEVSFTIPKSKAGQEYMSRKAKERQDQHAKQDPKHAKGHARNMVDVDKAAKKASKKGVKMRDYGRDNWKVRNGVKRGKLPEGVEQIDEAKFTDKEIKQAYGIINDKRWKGGNMTHIVDTIEKIAKGLSKHPGVQKALRATNEETGYKSETLKGLVSDLKFNEGDK